MSRFDHKLFFKTIRPFEAMVDPTVKLERRSYGSLVVDEASGGGRVKGKIIELYGWEASGKTITAMLSVATALNAGETVVYVDMEHALNTTYITPLLVGGEVSVEKKMENLIVVQPDCGEDAFAIVEVAIDSGADLVVFDSVASAIPSAELEGDVGDVKMGALARLVGQSMRMITAKASKNKTDIIFINQLREKIGVMFGNPETTPGGHAIKFAASVRIKVSRVSKGNIFNSNKELIGHTIRLKFEKNKNGTPFKMVEIPYLYGIGVCPHTETYEIAKSRGILKFKGSHVSYEGVKVGNGQANCIQFLKDNPEFYEELRAKII